MIRTLPLLAVLLALSTPGFAQTVPFDDPEVDILSEVVVVARSYGPAWWKVSNGNSVVWILGLPTSNTPRDLKWDKRTAERRINGANVFIGVPDGRTKLTGQWEETLPMYLQARVALAAVHIGRPSDRYWPPSLMSVVAIRAEFQKQSGLGLNAEEEMLSIAKRKRVRISKPRTINIERGPGDLKQQDAEVAACLNVMLDEVESDPAVLRATADHWANGRVAEVIAAPRDAMNVCMNRMMPGYSRRLIESQTEAIAAALTVPGKAVAVAPIRQLVAAEGILARLRAKGFTVADPTKPLEE